jgi:hypothetical protein
MRLDLMPLRTIFDLAHPCLPDTGFTMQLSLVRCDLKSTTYVASNWASSVDINVHAPVLLVWSTRGRAPYAVCEDTKTLSVTNPKMTLVIRIVIFEHLKPGQP